MSLSNFPQCDGVLFYTARSLTKWDGLLFWVGLTLMRFRLPKYVHVALYLNGRVVNLVDDGISVFPASYYDNLVITFVPYFVSPNWELVVKLMEGGVRIRWSDMLRCFIGMYPSGLVCTSFVSLFVTHSKRNARVLSADDLYILLNEPKSSQ